MKKPIMVLIIAVLIAGTLSAQQLPLKEVITQSARGVEGSLPQGTMVAILNFSSPSETFSDYVIEELIGELVIGKKIAIVDRQNLALISKEMNLQMSGDVSDESAQAIGKLLGAQAIVSGTLTNMGIYHRFRIRVISVETGRIQTQVSLDLQNDRQVAYLLGDDSKIASSAKNKTPVSRNSNDGNFDLNGKNVFAIGINAMIGTGSYIGPAFGGGINITVFEKHFSGGFVPGISFFIHPSVIVAPIGYEKAVEYDAGIFLFNLSAGVLAKWRIGQQDRFLWYVGFSYEFDTGNVTMYGQKGYDLADYGTSEKKLSTSDVGIRVGLSYRMRRNVSVDFNGFLKAGLDKLDFEDLWDSSGGGNSMYYQPIIFGVTLGVTWMLPY
jgi:TolB-like protein